MATLLTVVEGLNTGKLLWDSGVGQLIQGLINRGKIPNVEITQADLDADSIDLGIALDTLHADIERAKAEGR